MIDYKNIGRPVLPRRRNRWTNEAFHTLLAMGAVIICFSIMGWSCTEKYAQVPVSQHIDKQNVKRLTAQQLAEQTALINAEMEKRSKAK